MPRSMVAPNKFILTDVKLGCVMCVNIEDLLVSSWMNRMLKSKECMSDYFGIINLLRPLITTIYILLTDPSLIQYHVGVDFVLPAHSTTLYGLINENVQHLL